MENSAIEWTDHTFNPWMGCQKVSDGCKHCYAEALMDSRYGKVEWGPTGQRVLTSRDNWKNPIKWNKQAQKTGQRSRVFCASLADVFEDKPDQREEMTWWRRRLFSLINYTPHLDWLLLTKRPENINRMIEKATGFSSSEMFFYTATNAWVGTSVENQEQADRRIPHLLQVPAAVRFLSCEPLLGPVTLAGFDGKTYRPWLDYFAWAIGIHWVIVGGESGKNARPMHPTWVRQLRDQCVAANVPFFFKQWGEWDIIKKTSPTIYKGHNIGLFHDPRKNTDFGVLSLSGIWHHQHTGWNGRAIDPDTGEAYMVKVGKKSAGRLLDDRLWDEFPKASNYQQGLPVSSLP